MMDGGAQESNVGGAVCGICSLGVAPLMLRISQTAGIEVQCTVRRRAYIVFTQSK